MKRLKISGAWRQNFDDQSRKRRLHGVRITLTTVNSDVRTPDLAWTCFYTSVAGKWPAPATAELLAQLSDKVHNNVVVDVFGPAIILRGYPSTSS